MSSFSVSGNFVDVHQQRIYPATIHIENGKIESVIGIPESELTTHYYILPGFIDSHVHIESSMLVPSQFARLAVVHGTVATVSDPHEIANVCGMEGVEFMIKDGKTVPFKFNFGAPSCVPATVFETAGAEVNAADIDRLMQRDDIKYLAEMMNFPGVLNADEDVMKKIATAHKYGKPVDGHAPGLRGETAKLYIERLSQRADSKVPPAGGFRGALGALGATDHECFTKEEALDKLQYGMKILIREGSAAKNFDALIDLLHDWPEHMMFCSDDKHPDSLVLGHINQLCARAVAKGIDVFKVLRAACINPVEHYKLDVGLLREGDPADFILVTDLVNFNVQETYINGELVAKDGKSLVVSRESGFINNFNCKKKEAKDFEVVAMSERDKLLSNWLVENGETRLLIPVIEALDGQLITKKLSIKPTVVNKKVVSNVNNDILKIVVVNRYKEAPVAKAFIKNVGLKKGAIASSVAHDSHNIVAVGVDDDSICLAVNKIIEMKGGVSAAVSSQSIIGLKIKEEEVAIVALPVAGLMSNEDGYKVAEAYTRIDEMAKKMGCTLSSPFMTLSFMALLVIPHLKLSDLGLFDGDKFQLIN